MLLLIDIGNTSTSCGYYEGGKLKDVRYVPSNDFPKSAYKLLEKSNKLKILCILVTSVVPEITMKLRKIAKQIGSLDKFLVLGEDVKVPLKHRYRSINALGSDRLVSAYGAIKFYRLPLLILDYGTALTCDFISKEGVFMGGLIIPGPEVSFKALSEKAALLPSLEFPRKFSSFMGRDTAGGMKAGILQGYAAMTDGLVERFRKRFGKRFQVIATGGLARVIYPHTHKVDILDPHLTLKSLVQVYKDLIKT